MQRVFLPVTFLFGVSFLTLALAYPTEPNRSAPTQDMKWHEPSRKYLPRYPSPLRNHFQPEPFENDINPKFSSSTKRARQIEQHDDLMLRVRPYAVPDRIAINSGEPKRQLSKPRESKHEANKAKARPLSVRDRFYKKGKSLHIVLKGILSGFLEGKLDIPPPYEEIEASVETMLECSASFFRNADRQQHWKNLWNGFRNDYQTIRKTSTITNPENKDPMLHLILAFQELTVKLNPMVHDRDPDDVAKFDSNGSLNLAIKATKNLKQRQE
ncbi:hypothetical protein BJ684DRAFT_17351 [Piptocephalis cylindrospora]|uniref:Uncharacterized protein n=1 Tax=Piptocephalis cylindrospora TaxID=1907219 RepID=A0A4P9Y254_9FUNG|nr:hypothetical protein BJ684DRAFT_17351 [Piptocephalis cylindrospora]|eukprot:RKP12131.1 hypothetical protein BJ684DRAFT_17351 [Piptocephalis cylindrospora]